MGETAARIILAAVASGAGRADRCLKNLDMVGDEGPLWTGRLWDSGHLQSMCQIAMHESFSSDLSVGQRSIRLLERLSHEAHVDGTAGSQCYNVPRVAAAVGLVNLPKFSLLIERL